MFIFFPLFVVDEPTCLPGNNKICISSHYKSNTEFFNLHCHPKSSICTLSVLASQEILQNSRNTILQMIFYITHSTIMLYKRWLNLNRSDIKGVQVWYYIPGVQDGWPKKLQQSAWQWSFFGLKLHSDLNHIWKPVWY